MLLPAFRGRKSLKLSRAETRTVLDVLQIRTTPLFSVERKSLLSASQYPLGCKFHVAGQRTPQCAIGYLVAASIQPHIRHVQRSPNIPPELRYSLSQDSLYFVNAVIFYHQFSARTNGRLTAHGIQQSTSEPPMASSDPHAPCTQ